MTMRGPLRDSGEVRNRIVVEMGVVKANLVKSQTGMRNLLLEIGGRVILVM